MRRAWILISRLRAAFRKRGHRSAKPILVLRAKTERPEAVQAGTVKLVGTDEDAIVREAAAPAWRTPSEYERMARVQQSIPEMAAPAAVLQT